MARAASATSREITELEAASKVRLAYAIGRCSAGLLARQTGTGNGSKGKHYQGRVRTGIDVGSRHG